MSDDWYYVKNQQSVGPLGLQDLKRALHECANPGAVLVWRKGLSEWNAAGSFAELEDSDSPPPIPRVIPPAIPPAPRTPSQSRQTQIRLPTGLSRRWCQLTIGSYFLVALGFAVFFKMQEPVATWAGLTVTISELLGSASGLFVLSGALPMILWAIGRFRVEDATGPLFGWLVLLLGGGLLMVLGQTYTTDKVSVSSSGDEFVEGFIRAARVSCIKSQQTNDLNKQAGLTENQISAYCDCFANKLAPQITGAELVYYFKNKKPSPTTQRKMEDLLPTCAQAALGKDWPASSR